MDAIGRGDIIYDSEERFRIDLTAVRDDFQLAVSAPRQLLFREKVRTDLFVEKGFNDALFPVRDIQAAALRFKLSGRLQ